MDRKKVGILEDIFKLMKAATVAQQKELKDEVNFIAESFNTALLQDKSAPTLSISRSSLKKHIVKIRKLQKSCLNLHRQLEGIIDDSQDKQNPGPNTPYNTHLWHIYNLQEYGAFLEKIENQWPKKNVARNIYRWNHGQPTAILASDCYGIFKERCGNADKEKYKQFTKHVYEYATGKNPPRELDGICDTVRRYWEKIGPTSKEIFLIKLRLSNPDITDQDRLNLLNEYSRLKDILQNTKPLYRL